jgi:PleD family two-component response regulator
MLKNGQTEATTRILVVDDSEDSRELSEAALHSAGYKDVVTAASAADAYNLLDIGKRVAGGAAAVDLILLDVVMPDVDGIEVCARVRGDGRYADVPIIMVTSLADMDSLANAFMAGANDYINKPLNRIELLARVRSALKLKAELVRRQERERELLNFVSNRGNGRPSTCFDDVTGLFVGEVAEAYLTGAPGRGAGEPISVITLAVDRLDACRAAQGEKAANAILAAVAATVRAASAAVGVIAASYRNGILVVVAPGYNTAAAVKFAESLRTAVARLALKNVEAISADHVTVSLAVSCNHATRETDHIKLLTQAINSVQIAAARGGGNEVAVSA